MVLAASELTAAAVILQFWTDKLQPWHWAIIIIVPIFALQLIHVRVYGSFLFFSPRNQILRYVLLVTGESEYWFAMVKVLMIVLFIIVGLIFDWGGVKGHPGPVSLQKYGLPMTLIYTFERAFPIFTTVKPSSGGFPPLPRPSSLPSSLSGVSSLLLLLLENRLSHS